MPGIGDRNAVKQLMVEHMMTQYSLNAGLKKFGKAGEKAVTKELSQFHDMSVFEPNDASSLTSEDKKLGCKLRRNYDRSRSRN
jgi:hypothetical protein